MSAATGTAQGMIEELARLRAENERLKALKTTARKFSTKVSPKGALSVYGFGRFPVTLYAEQWERFLAEGIAVVQAGLTENTATLTRKGEGVEANA